MVGDQLSVLVVDDNGDCRDLYSIWLGDEHAVRMARDGPDGLGKLDDSTDIVLLDRDMPGPNGVEIARRIEEGPFDPHVVMVSSMEVDFDIVEVPIADYVQKPVDEAGIQTIVEQFRTQTAYRSALDEFFSLTAKLGALEARKTEAELAESDEYQCLQQRVDKKRTEVDEAIATADADWSVAFKTCGDAEEPQVSRPNV